MIRLDTTTRKLQALLGGAVATTEPGCVVSWSDKTATTYTGGATVIATNGTTPVDICAAPGASTVRDVDYISIRNNDTASISLTVRYNDNGTTYALIVATLATLEKLEYTHATGWKRLSVTGDAGIAGPIGATGAAGATGATGPTNPIGSMYAADFFGAA